MLKPFKTLEEQASRMKERGCNSELDEIIQHLKVVNYYRLSGYAYSFRNLPEDNFIEGTTIEKIWNLYRFDRRLRLLILDAIERIEIALRTTIAYHWAKSVAKKSISNPQKYDNYYRKKYRKQKLINELQGRYATAQDDCFVHHKNKLGISSVLELPVWVFVELAMFGNLLFLLKDGLKEEVKYSVAKDFGFDKHDFNSFISILTLIKEARNCSAHHVRVWNRCWIREDNSNSEKNLIAPEIKTPGIFNAEFCENSQSWIFPKTYNKMSFKGQTTMALLAFCSFFMQKLVPQSQWLRRLHQLFLEFPLSEKFLAQMGASIFWNKHPLFKIKDPLESRSNEI